MITLRKCNARQGIVLAVAALGCTGAHAQAFSERATSGVDYAQATLSPAMTCTALGGFAASDIVELNTSDIGGSSTVTHCRVTGVLDPEIAFEVSLPERWNGRFYMIGNGGHAGEDLDNPGRAAQRAQALSLGFAFAQTNTGHYASEEPGASFVVSDPQKAIDYAYRAVHLTAVTAKAITAEYYGRAASYSYWNSCSNGGRQGMIEAQRFPEDFDGIVANAPWVDQTGFTVGAIWNHRALTEAPVTAGKMALVADRVMAVCDTLDGLEDGLIDDPRACDFDPVRDVPACPAGIDTDQCLTPPQARAVASVYGGVVSDGKPYFSGFMPGSEAVMANLFGGGSGSGWMNVIVPAQPGGPAADFGLADNTMKYLVFTPPSPDWDYRDFDFDHDIPMLEAWGALANAKDSDLRDFRAAGGKIIMTYGWADSILQPMMGVDYYESALAENGPDTTEFFRLFMIPGMAHCGGGIGPDSHDPMTAIIEWVENGTAPESMIASKIVDGEVTRSRPLCPYPQVARHTGQGSIDEAASFRCVSP
ncbi:MAG TPA: tannase/feruloyl esterase family alpha/beta hydrolase [Gammaproteobacteria bacterium]|nr:tannase/feruloyl esterase family alpha/beta hydrolase [Gammaproteobacteria bacterium]